mmetsp:Transcript_343/g.765  ORF Transcript_343/g.765 Transcript_343/m.765 type:complete len:94 (+) Transcript_343:157-438(+)
MASTVHQICNAQSRTHSHGRHSGWPAMPLWHISKQVSGASANNPSRGFFDTDKSVCKAPLCTSPPQPEFMHKGASTRHKGDRPQTYQRTYLTI